MVRETISCSNNIRQGYKKDLLKGSLFVLLICLLIVSLLTPYYEFFSKILLNTSLFLVTVLFCLYLTGRIDQNRRDFFDPGFLFVGLVSLSLMPLALLAVLGLPVTIKRYWIILDIDIFSKVVFLHAILLLSFFLAYRPLLINKKIKYEEEIPQIWVSKTWIWLALILNIVTFYLSNVINVEKGYFMFILTGTSEIAAIIAVGVFLSRVSSVIRARILLVVIVALFFIIPNVLAAEKGVHFLSRGGAFVIGLGAACYTDRVRWKGKLLNWRLLIIFFLCGLIALGGSNILEDIYLRGSEPSFSFWARKTFTAFAPRVIENAGRIVLWIDYRALPFQYGKNYVNAIINLIPFEHSNKALTEWFAWKWNPSHAATGARYAFSAVAEGYLNFGTWGVVLHGAVLGVIAAFIRYLKFSKNFKIWTPFFYAVSLRMVFYLFRTDSFNIFKKFEIILIETGILFIIMWLLLFFTHSKKQKYKKIKI